MSKASPTEESFWSEKIVIEPDLGDQRKSVYKALPAPPTTPKRVWEKYRFSALVAFACVAAAFVLSIVVVLAGADDLFGDHYMVALNTTRVGQDIIRFEPITTTSAAPAASATTKPSNPLNPFSTDSPLNPNSPNSPFRGLGDLINNVSGNLTTAVDAGLGSLLNNLTEQVVYSAGVQDYYFFYLEDICTAQQIPRTNRWSGKRCSNYGDANRDLSNLLKSIQSSVVIGRTKISIPLLAQIPHSGQKILNALSALRSTIFAFLIISLVSSGIAMLSIVPGIIFPKSRLVVYINLSTALTGSVFSLLAALLTTFLVVGIVTVANGLSDAIGVGIMQGGTVLLFVWLAWVGMFLASVYWGKVWYSDFRTWRVISTPSKARKNGLGEGKQRARGPRVVF